jgi:hypothetical protein
MAVDVAPGMFVRMVKPCLAGKIGDIVVILRIESEHTCGVRRKDGTPVANVDKEYFSVLNKEEQVAQKLMWEEKKNELGWDFGSNDFTIDFWYKQTGDQIELITEKIP